MFCIACEGPWPTDATGKCGICRLLGRPAHPRLSRQALAAMAPLLRDALSATTDDQPVPLGAEIIDRYLTNDQQWKLRLHRRRNLEAAKRALTT